MSMYDDILDVENALDGADLVAFQRIENKLYEAQADADQAFKELNILKQCVTIQLNERITSIKITK